MITGINHITLAVHDVGKSFAFYTEIMGLTPIQKNPHSAYLLAGQTWIALIKDSHARSESLPEYTHIAFSVRPQDFAEAKARLLTAGVRKWKDNTTEGDSFYFLDPNGHKLEIHSTDLDARIRSAKESWGEEVEWFV